MTRKARLTEAEYKRLVLQETKRSSSMFESCLLPAAARHHPKITAQHQVEDSLSQDRLKFQQKYGPGSLEGEAPEQLAEKGLYAVELPRSPQHTKYTLAAALALNPPEPLAAGEIRNRPKFNIPTLRKWFQEIDKDGGGHVSRRELIVAMRNHKDLQAVLLSVVVDTSIVDTAEDVIQAKNAELKRIMAIMQEVDADGSGTMEWEEFVEFFRRSGFLLEYDTRATLNDTSFQENLSFFDVEAAAEKKQRLDELTAGLLPEVEPARPMSPVEEIGRPIGAPPANGGLRRPVGGLPPSRDLHVG